MRPATWRAPLWSWASIKDAVKFDELGSAVELASVADLHTVPVGSDWYGQIKSGSIRIKGFSLDGKIGYSPNLTSAPWMLGADWNISITGVYSYNIWFYPDCADYLIREHAVKILKMARSFKSCHSILCLVPVCIDEQKERYERVRFL